MTNATKLTWSNPLTVTIGENVSFRIHYTDHSSSNEYRKTINGARKVVADWTAADHYDGQPLTIDVRNVDADWVIFERYEVAR